MKYSTISIAGPLAWLNNPELRRKIIMRINLTTLLLIAALVQTSAKSYSQISINKKNAALEQVILLIEKQSDYVFLFNEAELNIGKINVQIKNGTIKQVLDACFKDMAVTYKIVDKNILLKPRESSIVEQLVKLFNKIDLKGRVVDENGNPLPGATIKVVGSNKFAVTDRNGTFIIDNVDENSKLSISFLGYEPLLVNAASDLSGIRLKASEAKLQEVVINKGYYATRQKLNTGSTVSVNAEQLGKQPVTNAIDALQGLVPGMFITQSNGMTASRTNIQIRGLATLGANTFPMYIIDGIPFSGKSVDQQPGTGQTIIGNQPNGSTDPLANINPSDIESITVLKDADATAIYGSRAANGVVLITTKRGSTGKARLDLNMYTGWSQINQMMPILATADFLEIRRQAFANDNKTPTVSDAPDLLSWDPNGHTDYQKMLIGNTASLNEANAAISGGNNNSTYYLSGTYRNEESVLMGDFGYERAAVNMKATHRSDDGKLNLMFSTNYSMSNNNQTAGSPTSQALSYPYAYPMYLPDGTANWDNFSNPLAYMKSSYVNKSDNLVLNGNIQYQLLSGLKFGINLGHNTVNQDQKQMYPRASQNPNTSTGATGMYSSNVSKTYIVEPQADFKQKIWKGQLNATMGGSYQASSSDMPYFVVATGFASDALLDSYASASTISSTRTYKSEYKYVSLFGRLNYALLDKYVLNMVFRRDGTSRFGPARKFGNFGSVGLAWVLSDEKFIKDLNVFSFAKLRGSYGITGNEPAENYVYLDSYASAQNYAYNGISGFRPSRVANPLFQWESSRKAELAAELGFLEDRISFNIAYFRNRSGNMITTSPLPEQTGFSSFTNNLDATIQNTGLEADLRVVPVKTKDLNWTLSFNITQSKNKYLKFPVELASSYVNSRKEGEPINLTLMYKFKGFEDGVARFEDLNGNGTINSGLLSDQVIAGTTNPEFYGGINSTLRYKRFQLDLFFNFVKQKAFEPVSFPGFLANSWAELKDSPFKPSTVTSSPSYQSYLLYQFSDAMFKDASYMRLRNASVSWLLPEKWTNTINVKNARLFVRGQNVLTFTNYKGLDPETKDFNMPPLQTFTAGFSCSF